MIKSKYSVVIKMILAICNSPEVLSVMKYVKVAVDLIKIIVPIALIISVMVSLINVVTGKAEEELPKALKSSVNKILAALLVFLVPTFVNIVFDVMDAKKIDFASCLNDATDENITAAFNKQAETYVAVANTSLLRGDYTYALSKVNNLKDESEKEELEEQLKEIEKKVKEREEKEKKALEEKLQAKSAVYGGYIGEGLVYPLGDYKGTTTTCFAAIDSLHSNPHGGIDIAAPGGTPIYAPADGKVVSTYDGNNWGSCGNFVRLDHGNGITTLYCHMLTGSVRVSPGDSVTQSQQIGSVGTTGHSTGNHLHFEIHKDGVGINPAKQLVFNVYDSEGCGVRTK